jgi:fibronectin-binding autotransporter adhesin
MKHIFNTVVLLLLSLPLSVQAANLYWDGGAVDIGGNGNGVSGGGSGTWNTTIKNWDQSGVPYIAWPVGANANQAFFAGSGGTVTFGSDMGPVGAYPNSVWITAGNYVFDLGAYGLSFRGSGIQIASGATLVLTNGTVTLLNSGVSVTGGNALKIYSKVSGAGVQFSKAGAGDVYLYNDANDFSGKLFGANALGVYFTSIKNSGVASAAGAGNTVETGYNNQMIYTGPGDTTDRTLSLIGNGYFYLKNNGTGPLVWTGPLANTMNAGTHILQFSGSNTGTNEFRGALSNSISGVLSVEKADAGTWILSGTNTFTGDFDVYGGTLRIGGAGQLGGGNYNASPNSIYIAAGATFDYSSSANQAIGSAIINSGGITMSGAGTLTLSGNNTYTARRSSVPER